MLLHLHKDTDGTEDPIPREFVEVNKRTVYIDQIISLTFGVCAFAARGSIIVFGVHVVMGKIILN